MATLTNNWHWIRNHYACAWPLIKAGSPKQYAIDAYAWEDAGVVMTPIEAALWHDIRAAGLVMYPQWPIGGVFVDFGNPVAKVAIECDGAAFHDPGRDALRDKALRSFGWRVYRVTGSECIQDGVEHTSDHGAVTYSPSSAAKLIRQIKADHDL